MNQTAPGPGWRARLLGALLLVLVVAIGTRVAAELLKPLLPALAILIVILMVIRITTGGRR